MNRIPRVEVNPPNENGIFDWLQTLPPEVWSRYLPIVLIAGVVVWILKKPLYRGIAIGVLVVWLIYQFVVSN